MNVNASALRFFIDEPCLGNAAAGAFYSEQFSTVFCGCDLFTSRHIGREAPFFHAVNLNLYTLCEK